MIGMNVLTGRNRQHLAQTSTGIWLHRDVIEPFALFQEAASSEGIQLAIASGFRDFARQLTIWNDKASGRRPVLSADGAALDVATLGDVELMYAILRWSALPGASRHHWGTDLDVWDPAAVSPDYKLELTPWEYSTAGPFARLAAWLDRKDDGACGFYRPYCKESGGVSPEPWHLSYRPVAQEFEIAFDLQEYADLLSRTEIALKGAILDHLEDIYSRFIRCP